jgi:hypothetical protein
VCFLERKGADLVGCDIDENYVTPENRKAPRGRENIEANARAVDYLFLALCQDEFERVMGKDQACKIWGKLKVAHGGDSHVWGRLFNVYRNEYENFVHLPGESIDAMFHHFTSMLTT